ncbi:MAG: tRNA (adenosine(37)-N6)-threonylcarbamoyltransferase complex ATPase subunit type 1 TsaE [Verrucomicrobiota bacterium]|nr:tRNA (adenosine(37)-N6)-threonylcarbamoyltransferase complex ATPase subunit type 1 TsaE [Verrucomicrobiota bacterium]
MKKLYLSTSEEETKLFAHSLMQFVLGGELSSEPQTSESNIVYLNSLKKRFADSAKDNRQIVFALHGELGAGKTVFSRGIAETLDINEYIFSPSYTVVNEYVGIGLRDLFHIDFYRIDNADSAIAFGIDDYFSLENSVIIMEWAERISDIIPQETVHILFEHVDENVRKLRLRN